jgi:peroxiredoxin Q/BCP
MLEVDQRAPGFELQDHTGETVSLAEFEGQYVVLYFYPKAKTRGCSIEARGFRDHHAAFRDRDAVVVGVSADPVEELAEFAEEEALPFRLLSDPDGEVGAAYDSYGEVEFRGETRESPFRNTYVIRPDGTIGAVYEDVTPEGHAEELLAKIDELRG